MQNKDTNKPQDREKDTFYDYFRDNLEDHQLPIGEECWENISQRIRPKKKKVLWKILYPSIAVAAAVAILFVLIVDKKTDSVNELQFGKDNIVIQISDSIENKILPNNIQVDKTIETLANTDKPTAKGTTVQTKKENESLVAVSTIDTDTSTIQLKTADENAHTTVIEKKEIIKDSIPVKRKTSEFDLLFNERNNQQLAYKPKKNNKWELLASVKASETTSGSGSPDQMMFSPSYLAQSSEDQTILKSKEKISDAKYAPPFTVGVLARKRLNSTLSIETGLTYSYLSTTYKDTEKDEYTAKLKLHYIGIPVNIVVDVWNITPQWKIYTSAGIMVEKGIKSDFSFSQDIYSTNQSIASKQSIKGIQWSLNASIGVSYRFYRNWNLYLEPHASYYFDNNQPISIRTEKQTIVGVNSGLRYEF